MPTAVITGCNSGLGQAFAKLLIEDGYDVTATDRELGEELLSFGCATFNLDVSSPRSIADFKAEFHDTKPLDVLLNIAGIMPTKEQDGINSVNVDVLNKTFAVNTFGPLLLTQALLPNLRASEHPKIGIMSSRVGSIADNSSGCGYAYRASKAAVNCIGKTLSVDLKNEGLLAPVILMHPGFVKSGLDPATWQMDEAVMPEYAARKLWKLFCDKGMEDTGKFFHREGQELPW